MKKVIGYILMYGSMVASIFGVFYIGGFWGLGYMLVSIVAVLLFLRFIVYLISD